MRLPFSIFAVLATQAVATVNLHVELRLGGPQVNSENYLPVTTIVTNLGVETAKLIKDQQGILSDFPADKFDIKGPFGAPKFHNIPLQPNQTCEYVVLEAGKTLEVQHDLADLYDFTISGKGEYMITTEDPILYFNEELHRIERAIYGTNVLKVTLRGPLASLNRRSDLLPRVYVGHDMSFKGFSKSQKERVAAAANKAEKLIDGATSYLNNMDTGGDDVLYEARTWFGRRNTPRYKLVKSIYRRIRKDPTQTTYYHRCTPSNPNAAAEVYRVIPHEAYLTDRFFDQPENGLDSQAGTLVHEHTHCNKNRGGTEDHAYGVQAARLLAETDPDQAVRNADNYQYFAEEVHRGGPVTRACNYLCSLASCCRLDRTSDEYSLRRFREPDPPTGGKTLHDKYSD